MDSEDSDSDVEVQGRQKYLPLEELDECGRCHRIGGLRLCESCAEIAYCSQSCQRADWKRHKAECGETDRVDIQSFYPLLASIIQNSRTHPDIRHPALSHKIVNSPNPGTGEIVQFPDGSAAKLVLLGEKLPPGSLVEGLQKWWPSGSTAKVRHRLLRRIVSEGLLLPTLLATTVALVSEMYTTTAIPPSEPEGWQVTGRRRVRLTYGRSPIADFGIVRGSVRVTPQDKLAYYNLDKSELMMGQDPNDHYWIYFTTISGEEYFLDCGMATFNFGLMVEADPYCQYGLPLVGQAPAFWFGRELVQAIPALERISWRPKKKYSILRESRFSNMLRFYEYDYCHCHDELPLFDLMDEIANRTCTAWEREMLFKFLPNACQILRLNMRHRQYLKFPKEPALVIEKDPGEKFADGRLKEDEALYTYLRKWSLRLKKGKVSPKQWEKAFKAWKNNPHGTRMQIIARSEKIDDQVSSALLRRTRIPELFPGNSALFVIGISLCVLLYRSVYIF